MKGYQKELFDSLCRDFNEAGLICDPDQFRTRQNKLLWSLSSFIISMNEEIHSDAEAEDVIEERVE